MNRLFRSSAMFLLLATTISLHASAQTTPGVDASRLTRQRAMEGTFDSLLNKDNLRTWLKQLSAHPHHTGSIHDKENVEFIASQFRSWGYAAEIEEFRVLFPTPKIRVLEMTAPSKFSAVLTEPALPEDATSGLASEQLPLYNIFSADGDVSGQLVYVNYGVPKDYEELDRRGIDVRGKIVIARYGGSWRGIKPKVAAEHGAIGCIIYSDPHEDGYFQGDVYPKGAFRNQLGGQRGSVMDMPLFPGDPLTPFSGATTNAKRLSVKEAPTLMKIPVLPISYADALPFLQAMGGPVAPESWRGALPITYHCGPGPATVHLKLEFSWDIVSIYDVIAKLEGNEYPDEWVIRGNHQDGWVNGAEDPLSGLVSMLDEARAVGELARRGTRPKRTIVYCAWDAEEQGLIGSTEWVETHAAELTRNAVIYINSDGIGRGFLFAGGSHTLEKFVNEVARDVVDPQKQASVAERRRASDIIGAPASERKDLRGRTGFRLSALGSGSDYSPFLQHLGIAALNIGYGGEDNGGSYHSIYDSFDHYSRFGDPGFVYGITQSQTTGRMVLRLANANVLPFNFDNLTETIARYCKEVMKLTDDMREETDELNLRIREKSFDLNADPLEVWITPRPKEAVPHLNFSPLENALAGLKKSTSAFAEEWKKLDSANRSLSPEAAQRLNRLFIDFERSLTTKEGLPGRPWYIHHVYAPGKYTGYGVKTLPGVREAIEARNWKEADAEIEVAARVLNQAAASITQACSLIE